MTINPAVQEALDEIAAGNTTIVDGMNTGNIDTLADAIRHAAKEMEDLFSKMLLPQRAEIRVYDRNGHLVNRPMKG